MTSIAVTKSTLGRNAVYFIVSVLRHNLTDTQTPVRNGKEWILKSESKENIDITDFPKIVLNGEIEYESITLDGGKNLSRDIDIICDIYTQGDNAIAKRDDYSDQIRTILFNPDSTDADGTTLRQSNLILREFTDEVTDFPYTRSGNTQGTKGGSVIIRSKAIHMRFRFKG
ncbi:MAG: hypothetical protein WC444_05550 [Candidatus Paceibacterota bacterium]